MRSLRAKIPSSARTFGVSLSTISFALLPPADAMKCDIGGAELEVLGGAKVLLERHHPWIICETHSENNDRVARKFFGPLGSDTELLDVNHILAEPKAGCVLTRNAHCVLRCGTAGCAARCASQPYSGLSRARQITGGSEGSPQTAFQPPHGFFRLIGRHIVWRGPIHRIGARLLIAAALKT